MDRRRFRLRALGGCWRRDDGAAGPPWAWAPWLEVLDRPGDRLKLRVIRMAGAPGQGFGSGFRARLFAWGGVFFAWGLALPAATPPTTTNAGATPFSFPIAEWYPMRVQVRAVLRDDTGEVADAVAYFNVTQRHRDQFNFLSWDVPRGPTAAWAHEALAGLGVTLELGRFTEPPPVMAAYEMAAAPYTTRIRAEKDEQGWMKPLPWNQEPERIGVPFCFYKAIER